MSEKLNWGVMGNATIARKCVIPAIQNSTNGRAAALASRHSQKAASVVERHRIPRLYDDYQSLLEDPAIEAVYIPLPNHLHHKWACKALSAGKHVLCEKPLACSARQAEEMAATAKASGRLLMEGFMYRFHPRSLEVRQKIMAGAIGAPRLVRASFCFHMAAKDLQDPDNTRLKPQGGGALLDVGSYGVSVARWLLGAEPNQVQCQAHYHPGGADLHVAGVLRFPGQRLATIEASFIAGLMQSYTVVGETGAIELPHDAFIPWEEDAAYTLRKNDAAVAAPSIIAGADEYQLMVEHFASAARNDIEPAFDVSDSVANMRVLDALAQAAKSGQTVRLSME